MNILGAIKSDNRIIRYTKIGVLFGCVLLCSFVILGKNDYAIAEDEVITTHIWATKYDNKKHWEYCTLCGAVRNEIAHTYVEKWAAGYKSCYRTNYCTCVCECGYSYKYTMPHEVISNWLPWKGRFAHFKQCTACTQFMELKQCTDQEGDINCKNPGTCTVCGVTTTSDYHYISTNGYCRDCGVQFIKIDNMKTVYNEDRTVVDLSFDMHPMQSSVKLSGYMYCYAPYSNFGPVNNLEWKSVAKSDGSYSFSTVLNLDSGAQRKATIQFIDRSGVVYVNGTSCYVSDQVASVDVYQDNEAPVLNEVIQVDQKTHNTWATIKELTISGTDKYTTFVTITIKDKETGQVVIDKAKADVINKQFNYKCTPPIEGPVTGREYLLEIADEIGNKTTETFTIYKTDSKPPTLASNDTYTEWSRQKEILFNITDNGAGGVQTSLVDQVSYKSTLKDGDNYYAEYYFGEENYGATSYNLYLKDGLGNATKTVVTVGKIDLTKPTIENTLAKKENNMVVATIKANDFSKRMGAEGSGPNMYAITETPVVPTEGQWQKSNEVKAYNPGRYYLWVKDLAGNIGDAAVLDVDPKLNPDIDPNDKIIYDSGVKEDDSIVKDNNEKTDSIKNNTVDKLNGDLSRYDDTPKTGDYNYLVLYIILMISSGFMMIVINVCSRRKVQKTNIHK